MLVRGFNRETIGVLFLENGASGLWAIDDGWGKFESCQGVLYWRGWTWVEIW